MVLREDNAKTTPILRFAQEQALRVKPMLGSTPLSRRTTALVIDREEHTSLGDSTFPKENSS